MFFCWKGQLGQAVLVHRRGTHLRQGVLNFDWLADQKNLTLEHIIDSWTYSLGVHTGLTGTPQLVTIMLDRTVPFKDKDNPNVYFTDHVMLPAALEPSSVTLSHVRYQIRCIITHFGSKRPLDTTQHGFET